MKDLGRHSTSELRLRCSTKLLRLPVEAALHSCRARSLPDESKGSKQFWIQRWTHHLGELKNDGCSIPGTGPTMVEVDPG